MRQARQIDEARRSVGGFADGERQRIFGGAVSVALQHLTQQHRLNVRVRNFNTDAGRGDIVTTVAMY